MSELISGIIPAVDGIRAYKEFLQTDLEKCVLMNVHLALLEGCFASAGEYNKQIILHIDRITGLADDEAGAEYVLQKYHPAGGISIKPSVILTMKRKRVKAIQRIFLIDSFALSKSAEAVKHTEPDFIEVMPGICGDLTPLLKEKLGENLIAGGLIPDVAYAEKLLCDFKAVTMSLEKLKRG